jgi:hypothetical protein
MDAAIDIAARISGATTDVASRVTSAIRDAAKATGAGFEYLLNTAMRESNLNPDAKAKTSSATGLFQFIDQTWLATMKESGGKLGYGQYADAISKSDSGRYVVNDPAMRDKVFGLRKDPTANALMAGEFANSNAKVLNNRLGRKPTDGELYMAHFLGASGAARFIKATEASPDAKAANFFPRAAQANAPIFYDRAGNAKSLKQVYAGLAAKHNVMSPTQLAELKQSAPMKATQTAQAVAETRPTTPLAFFRDIPPAAVTPVSASAGIAAIASATGSDPSASAPLTSGTRIERSHAMFESLYNSDDRGPVGPLVRELWGARRASATETSQAVAPAADAAAAGGASVNAPQDLFNFLRSSARNPT